MSLRSRCGNFSNPSVSARLKEISATSYERAHLSKAQGLSIRLFSRFTGSLVKCVHPSPSSELGVDRYFERFSQIVCPWISESYLL